MYTNVLYSLFMFSSRQFLRGSLCNSGMHMLCIFAGWVTLPHAIGCKIQIKFSWKLFELLEHIFM